MAASDKVSRRQQILEALAHELETSPGERITTAGLARAVGVSEAALYRHFASKAQMFEGLIQFAEETVFSRVNRILADEPHVAARCDKILRLLLAFSERNPGISRVLAGDALMGETPRLRARVNQFYERLETQFKQILREGELAGAFPVRGDVGAWANALLALAEGRIHQFVRSGFRRLPTEGWDAQWPLLARGIFTA